MNHLMTKSDRVSVYNDWISFGSSAAIPVEDFAGIFMSAATNGLCKIETRLKSKQWPFEVFRGTRQECRNRVWWFIREMRAALE